MFELMNTIHNDIDGSYCYGMLQYVQTEYGSRGEICTYRCSQCGMLIRNLEGRCAPRQPAFGNGMDRSRGRGNDIFGMDRDRGWNRNNDIFGRGLNSPFGTDFDPNFDRGYEDRFSMDPDGYNDGYDEGGFW